MILAALTKSDIVLMELRDARTEEAWEETLSVQFESLKCLKRDRNPWLSSADAGLPRCLTDVVAIMS